MKYFTNLMFLLFHLTLSEDDKECEEADVCIPSGSCEYYQQQLQLIQNEKQVTIKNEILTTLRRVFSREATLELAL